jgi:hypothetical protein
MANRQCLISASRYSASWSGDEANLSGSKPKFPAYGQSTRGSGHRRKGSAVDMTTASLLLPLRRGGDLGDSAATSPSFELSDSGGPGEEATRSCVVEVLLLVGA